jgi:hypothetical protein
MASRASASPLICSACLAIVPSCALSVVDHLLESSRAFGLEHRSCSFVSASSAEVFAFGASAFFTTWPLSSSSSPFGVLLRRAVRVLLCGADGRLRLARLRRSLLLLLQLPRQRIERLAVWPLLVAERGVDRRLHVLGRFLLLCSRISCCTATLATSVEVCIRSIALAVARSCITIIDSRSAACRTVCIRAVCFIAEHPSPPEEKSHRQLPLIQHEQQQRRAAPFIGLRLRERLG